MGPFRRSIHLRLLLGPRRPVIVASMGRSGSTLLVRAIVDATVRSARVPGLVRKDWIAAECWELADLRPEPGRAYKTHDFAEPIPPRARRAVDAIFVHGDVVDSVASVLGEAARRGEDWLRSHLAHLHSGARSAADLLEYDALRIEDQLRSWGNAGDLRLCRVSYESLWDHERQIAEFLGLPVRLPPRAPRSASTAAIGERIRGEVERNYAGAIALQRAMPRFRNLDG